MNEVPVQGITNGWRIEQTVLILRQRGVHGPQLVLEVLQASRIQIELAHQAALDSIAHCCLQLRLCLLPKKIACRSSTCQECERTKSRCKYHCNEEYAGSK